MLRMIIPTSSIQFEVIDLCFLQLISQYAFVCANVLYVCNIITMKIKRAHGSSADRFLPYIWFHTI